MNRTLLFGLLLASISTSLSAQLNCKRFEDAIEGSLREVAMQRIPGEAEKTIAGATIRLMKIANEQSQIQINVQLMAANNCPVLDAPIDAEAYVAQAAACRDAYSVK